MISNGGFMQKQGRQSNIEMLRIIAIFGVIILHYHNPKIGGGMIYAESGTINNYIMHYLQAIFCCVVDLFMLISGYFLCDSFKRDIWKPISLLVQVMIFQFGAYLVGIIIEGAFFSWKSFLGSFIPSNYFVILYCTVFIVSPFLNVLLEHLDQRNFKTFVIFIFTLFSLWSTGVDLLSELKGTDTVVGLSTVGAYGTQWGYSFVNFLMMYILGAYLKKRNYTNYKTSVLVFIFFVIALLISCWDLFDEKIGYMCEPSSMEYCNPLVILEAVVLFLIFKKNDIGTRKWINRLASASFTVYLFHGHVLKYVGIEKYAGGILYLPHLLATCIGIFIVSYLVHIIYHFVMDKVLSWISKKIKIPPIIVED